MEFWNVLESLRFRFSGFEDFRLVLSLKGSCQGSYMGAVTEVVQNSSS